MISIRIRLGILTATPIIAPIFIITATRSPTTDVSFR